MNNKAKNEIAEEYKLYPLSETDGHSRRKNLLIKRDYYSSDNEHGRDLLLSYLEALEDSDIEIDTIYLVDSAVRLCSEDSPLFRPFLNFVSHDESGLICCSSSVETYSIRLSESFKNIICLPAYDLFAEVLQDPELIIID